MSPRCTVCSHPQRAAIDRDILGEVANRRIAAQRGLTETSVRRHHAHIARRIEKHEAAQARTLAGDTAEALAIVREVARALTLTPEQAEAMTVLQGLQSGYYELKLKVADRLLKNAELVHGTKAKVTTAADPRADWAALPVAEKRERLVEMKHRLLELEREAGTVEEQH